MGDKRYVIGVDGGGTKTACIVSDLSGNELAINTAGGSNHQTIGISSAMENVFQAIGTACDKLSIGIQDIEFIFLGMAGVDFQEDTDLISGQLKDRIGKIPFKLVNDSWIAFSSATKSKWGAISVCGTGNNLAVRDRNGKIHSVRALRYMLGNYGGGIHLTEMALHRAFRCDEGTGEYTELAKALPPFCNCLSMNELAEKIYTSDYQYQRDYNIPKLVFDLARKGDKVCDQLIRDMANEVGEMIGRLIVRSGLESEAVPLVLSGSLYVKDEDRLFIPRLVEKVREYVPKVEALLAETPPVFGALMEAFSCVGISLPEERVKRIREFIRESSIT